MAKYYGWRKWVLIIMTYVINEFKHWCNGLSLVTDKCTMWSRYNTANSFRLPNSIQYIPRNMHTVFALLCFVVVIHWLIFPYPSGLLHWHCGNLTIAPVPAKQPWWIWINTSCEFIMNDCITTTKQSTTKLCAYFLGYTVCCMKVTALVYSIPCYYGPPYNGTLGRMCYIWYYDTYISSSKVFDRKKAVRFRETFIWNEKNLNETAMICKVSSWWILFYVRHKINPSSTFCLLFCFKNINIYLNFVSYQEK